MRPQNDYYIYPDHLGTVRLVTDSSNNVVWRNLPVTEPFGNSPVEDDPGNTGNHFTFNLRHSDYYYDRETGNLYAYFRDNYFADLGRFGQSDPIGLAGGSLSTYSFVNGNPVSYTDPTGLATYQCTRRLNNVPFRAGPLYHQYVCTGNAKAGYKCSGLGPSGSNPFDSPGKIEGDSYNAASCEKVQDDNQCIESCIAKKVASPPPNYSVDLSHGENCQTYATDTVSDCALACARKSK